MSKGEPLKAKTVIVGDAGVGKTCITRRAFSKDNFDALTEPTLGSEFVEGLLTNNAGEQIKFEVWDTAGQETYRSLAPVFVKNATIAIFVYDITKKESLAALDYFHDMVKNHSPPNCFIAVVGNKIDLESARAISRDQGSEYAEKIKSTLFVETSAVTGEGIDELFASLANQKDLPYLTDNKIAEAEPNSSKGNCC